MKTKHSQPLFLYLLTLTSFFCLLELSFFIQGTKAYIADFTVVSHQINIPIRILPPILFFLFAQILIHVTYTVIIYFITLISATLLRFNANKTLYFAITIWIIGILAVLFANAYFYPNSRFAKLFPIEISTTAFSTPKNILSKPTAIHDGANSKHPNIIIIGIDSLRPDFLRYFGSETSSPFLDSLLKQSSVFTEAITPLARTYPSWMSILTGQHPQESGIRSNLAKKNQLVFAKTLPNMLRQHGYQSIYASDETRFSNIDQEHGFDRIISPPTGLNDFLLGSLNDFPLSNLLINTSLGRWLFPYSYANRAAYFVYDPNSFLSLMQATLSENRSHPVFLAVHFCLPHFPYLWSGLNGEHLTPQQRYQASIERVDQQLSDFFAMLKHYQFLNHAIVVLLSDHGEALELPGDRITESENYVSTAGKTIPRFYPPSLDNEQVNQSAGHGTDVLGLNQYHTLLAFKLYGMGKQTPGDMPGLVSLIDIKPALLTLLNLPNLQPAAIPAVTQTGAQTVIPRLVRGIHLGINTHIDSAHKPQDNNSPPRHFFIESDFSPQSIRTVYPNIHHVLLEGVQLFDIDPSTTRLILKDEMAKMIINSKQYADIYQNWMLAYYPQGQNNYMPILVNLKTGQWTNDLNTPFARHAPVNQMKNALKNFYKDELSTV